MLDLIYNLYSIAILSIGNLQTWFSAELLSNDFLIGILVPGILAAAVYSLKGFIFGIYNYIRLMVTCEITVNTDNEYYDAVASYLFNKTVSKTFQRFFNITWDWKTEKLLLTIGYGRSLGFVAGRPIIINREIEESQSNKFKEKITILVIGSRRKVAELILQDAIDIVSKDQEENLVRVQMNKEGYTQTIAKKPHRSLDTIIIPESDKKYITGKIDKFLKSEDHYNEKGLPYHLGIILSGPPGTGKTSTIHALASHYNRNIFYQNGTTLDYSADQKSVFNVIEDIDANGMDVEKRASNNQNNEKDKTSKISGMSELLNTLDGILSPHGAITIATTNHYDKLDAAITRPGRFDVHLVLDNMKYPEWVKLAKLLDRKSIISESDYKVISPSKARYILLYYSDEELVDFFDKME